MRNSRNLELTQHWEVSKFSSCIIFSVAELVLICAAGNVDIWTLSSRPFLFLLWELTADGKEEASCLSVWRLMSRAREKTRGLCAWNISRIWLLSLRFAGIKLQEQLRKNISTQRQSLFDLKIGGIGFPSILSFFLLNLQKMLLKSDYCLMHEI